MSDCVKVLCSKVPKEVVEKVIRNPLTCFLQALDQPAAFFETGL